MPVTCIYVFNYSCNVHKLYVFLFMFREISRAAGKVVTGIIEDENIGNNSQYVLHEVLKN